MSTMEFNTAEELAGFLLRHFSDATGHGKPISLILDVDGTIIDIADKPENVKDPELDDALQVLRANGLNVAINTGRSEEEVDRWFPKSRPAAAFLHGVSVRTQNGESVVLKEKPDFTGAIAFINDKIAALCNERGLDSNKINIEEKGYALALHYRALENVPEWLVTEFQTILDDACAAFPDLGEMGTKRGTMVLELGYKDLDKRTALNALMEMDGFKGTTPYAAGDTNADLPMLKGALEMGGVAFVVGNDFKGDTERPYLTYHVKDAQTMREGIRVFANMIQRKP